jgi:hypothetical protein
MWQRRAALAAYRRPAGCGGSGGGATASFELRDARHHRVCEAVQEERHARRRRLALAQQRLGALRPRLKECLCGAGKRQAGEAVREGRQTRRPTAQTIAHPSKPNRAATERRKQG